MSVKLTYRPVVQIAFDLSDALTTGYVRIYNRGGENADRDYDGYFLITQIGGNITVTSQAVQYQSASTILNITGYSF